MSKIRLDAEALEVESFEAVAAEKLRGTVRAHDDTNPPFSECGYEFTYDPLWPICYSYAVQCPPSHVPTGCTPSEPTNYWCDSCRDSVTAC
jgi:hypothetical protein